MSNTEGLIARLRVYPFADAVLAADALETQAREIEALRAALQEADTIMSHDDASTEWRDKWARLWVEKAVTP